MPCDKMRRPLVVPPGSDEMTAGQGVRDPLLPGRLVGAGGKVQPRILDPHVRQSVLHCAGVVCASSRD